MGNNLYLNIDGLKAAILSKVVKYAEICQHATGPINTALTLCQSRIVLLPGKTAYLEELIAAMESDRAYLYKARYRIDQAIAHTKKVEEAARAELER